MKRLIVTADDFGFSKSISEGIAKARKEGIVTSINLLPTGQSFEESLYLLKDLKLEEVGAHLSLTETFPVTYPGQIPTLIAREGRFHKNRFHFFTNLVFNRISRREIYLELKNQLNRIKKIGLPITNLTSHEHIHMMPRILGIFTDLAKEYHIPFVRCLRDDKLIMPVRLNKFFRLVVLSSLGKNMESAIRKRGLHTADHFAGFLDSGNLSEEILLSLLNKLEDGLTELVCHPGFLSPEFMEKCIFQLNCEGELASVTSRRVKKFIQDNGIALATFGNAMADGKK